MRGARQQRPIRVVACLLGLLLGGAAVQVEAQETSTGTAVIRGTVYDSLASRALRGATVQLLGVPGGPDSAFSRFATTGDEGAYTIEGIPNGEYVIGIFHPSADSLGLDLPARRITVRAPGVLRVDLGIPSHRGAIVRVCGKDAASDTTALIVGFVRDVVTGNGAANASVLLEWTDLVIGRGTWRQEPQQLRTSARGDGWYALCNVPVNALMELRAARGNDTTGAIAADLVAQKVVLRDLYVGPATRVASADTAIGADVLAGLRAAEWKGPARLTGSVRGVRGEPIVDARVAVLGGTTDARTNANGAFTLVDLPAGSRTLIVRALGFVPERRTVHLLLDDAENTEAITLTSLKSVLDTVRVVASRMFDADVNGFEARKRAGIGHFVDRAAIERKQPLNPSDVLRMIPGVRVVSSGVGFFGKVVAMKAPFGSGLCQPDLYVDGMYFRGGTAELDELVQPDEIEGIEIYARQSQAPVQYANRMTGCGSLVVWTRQVPRIRR